MNQVRSKGVDLYANVHSEHAIKMPKKGKESTKAVRDKEKVIRSMNCRSW